MNKRGSTRKHIETVVSDCNHYTMVFENREDINGHIEDFLNKLEK